MKKNNLDERQEQALLHIEHTGCWIAFWGLLLAILIQLIVYGFDLQVLAGEWIVFMVLCFYISFACMRRGIWDRRLKPNAKTNLIASLAAGVLSGAVSFLTLWHRFPNKPAGSVAAGLISAALVFVLCFVTLTIFARATKKKQQALEQEPEEDQV